MRLRTPESDRVARFDCVGGPDQIDWRPDDAVLLCMKTQDTLPALGVLRAAGVEGQPVFCLQNGIANEGMALRLFPDVHGVTVMLPASFLKPGEVVASSIPQLGGFDIGRYPGGSDGTDAALCEILTGANIAAYVHDDVMRSKRGKLLLNLGNAVQAALGVDAPKNDLGERMRNEAKAVFAALGLDWDDMSTANPRRARHMNIVNAPGVERIGSSTVQSLVRGLGSVETDYLNGEIVLMGRMAGVPTPVNAYMARLGARLARIGAAPGTVTLDKIHAVLG